MAYSHVAYVDEAGDEGFGKLRNPDQGGQSNWLLLGAAIVRQSDDLSLPAWRNNILNRLNRQTRRDLHFKDLKHDQRVVASQELANNPIFSCVTFSHKITLPGTRWAVIFKQPGYLYNYMTRWLLERITTFCASDAAEQGLQCCNLKVVFSRRGGTNYQAMRGYMELMRDGRELIRPVRSIDWAVLDPANIVVENHSKWAGLQLADVVTSSFFAAVEPNRYGNFELSYADNLRNTVLRHGNGNALNYGITPVPSLGGCQANVDQRSFFESFSI